MKLLRFNDLDPNSTLKLKSGDRLGAMIGGRRKNKIVWRVGSIRHFLPRSRKGSGWCSLCVGSRLRPIHPREQADRSRTKEEHTGSSRCERGESRICLM